jgi:hypothetical protein
VERLVDARRAEGDAGALATSGALARTGPARGPLVQGYLRFQLALAAFGNKELEAAEPDGRASSRAAARWRRTAANCINTRFGAAARSAGVLRGV